MLNHLYNSYGADKRQSALPVGILSKGTYIFRISEYLLLSYGPRVLSAVFSASSGSESHEGLYQLYYLEWNYQQRLLGPS